MPETSRSISQTSENKLRSALVKAFDAWTTPYDIAPDGVFGSVAIIQSGGVTLSSEKLDVEFIVPFDDDMEPNEADITVYNLSDNTIKQLKDRAALSITAGYKGDTGVLFSGFISKVETTYEGADKVTMIHAMDDIKEHKLENVSFSGGTKASYILKTLIEKTGIPIAVFKMRRDHTYKDSQTVDGDLMECIHKYADVCGVSVYVSRGKVYARYLKEGDNLNFTVSTDTGMIGSPSSYTKRITVDDQTETINGYKVEMLLQHRMAAGAIVNLKSKVANGTYRVCGGMHEFSVGEATTTIKMY